MLVYVRHLLRTTLTSQIMIVSTITSGSIHDLVPPAGLLKFVSDVTGTHITSVNGADVSEHVAIGRTKGLREVPSHRHQLCEGASCRAVSAGRGSTSKLC